MRVLAISSLAATLLLPTPARPVDASCTGCLIEAGAEGNSQGSVGACNVYLWKEVSGFAETCGNGAESCSEATCEYTWKVYYKTTGDCESLSGLYFHYGGESPASGYSAAATAVKLDQGTWGPKKCGLDLSYLFQLSESDNPNEPHIVLIAGDDGCAECSPS